MQTLILDTKLSISKAIKRIDYLLYKYGNKIL